MSQYNHYLENQSVMNISILRYYPFHFPFHLPPHAPDRFHLFTKTLVFGGYTCKKMPHKLFPNLWGRTN